MILTAGTFLNGKLFIGHEEAEGGRIGELPSHGLTEQLVSLGLKSDRMKTGTPPRVDVRSIDLSKLEVQSGDDQPARFSYLPYPTAIQSGQPQKPCYIVHTNPEVHAILESGFQDSPLFTGKITGIGPRYCPSIEDKLRTFAGKDAHQLFLEPEGWNTYEYYLQGFSSSLPLDIQMRALRAIKGFENIRIFRPAYAVEYDFFDPTQLYATLESRVVENLYLAGQVNGTTGYEEAAAQGLMAGINAHLNLSGKDSFVLKRDEAYIGVLIDDLITKGVDEPYRMFTSRAEYRILLRQDDADLRLTEKAYQIGLADDFRYRTMQMKYEGVNQYVEAVEKLSIKPDQINSYLDSIGSARLTTAKKLSEILTRPDTSIREILKNVPRGTISETEKDVQNRIDSVVREDALDNSSLALLKAIPFQEKQPVSNDFRKQQLADEILEAAEIAIKYQGYIDRERRLADKILRLENVKIPDNFDYSKLTALSMECRIKLERYRPKTISQASRISGVSPADIAVLLVYFGR